MSNATVTGIFVSAMLATAATAAVPAPRRFEVASIKATAGSGHMMSLKRQPGGRLVTEGTSLRMLMGFAYDVREQQISGGPAWMASDGWDITAKPEGEVPAGPDGAPMIREMMQTLLAERFGVTLHKESKEMPVYALVAAKGGPKLKPAPDANPGQAMVRMGMGQMNLTGGMPQLAAQLTRITGRAVNDETGLTGAFELKLEWTPDAGQMAQMTSHLGAGPAPEASPAEGPTIYTALQEQLGLRLENKKAMVGLIIVDHAEKPSEN